MRTLTFSYCSCSVNNESETDLLEKVSRLHAAFGHFKSVSLHKGELMEFKKQGHLKWKQQFFIQKKGNSVTWKEVMVLVNKIHAPAYSYVPCRDLSAD